MIMGGVPPPNPHTDAMRPFDPIDGRSPADAQFDPVPSLARRPVPARRPPKGSGACRTASHRTAPHREPTAGERRAGPSGAARAAFRSPTSGFVSQLRAGPVFSWAARSFLFRVSRVSPPSKRHGLSWPVLRGQALPCNLPRPGRRGGLAGTRPRAPARGGRPAQKKADSVRAVNRGPQPPRAFAGRPGAAGYRRRGDRMRPGAGRRLRHRRG